MINEPQLFIPHTGKHGAAPIVRESRLIADLSMPERDWSEFDTPAVERMTARRVRYHSVVSKLEIVRQAG